MYSSAANPASQSSSPTCAPAAPSSTASRIVAPSRNTGIWDRYPMRSPLWAERVPSSGGISPARMESSVDLPGAVRPDEPDAIARVHGARDPLEQGTRTEGLREAGDGQEGGHETGLGLLASGGRRKEGKTGGADGARTRDLRRDRPAL